MEYMQRCIELAQKGLGHVSPNPLVGSIVIKETCIIGEGYHKACGQNHAEIEALNSCKESPQGATMYVSLEPCSVYGKTPPCTEAIIKSGISKVIIGSLDPSLSKSGISALKKAGIEVEYGILQEECDKLNEIFFYNIKNRMPFVALKSAISLDGKIGIKGKQIQISSEEAMDFAHYLRQKYDAILIGSETAKIDNPHLGIRRKQENPKDPLRIILDKKNRLSPDLQIFRDKNYLLCTHKAYNSKEDENKHNFELNFKGEFNLQEILSYLYKAGIRSVLVEGGATTYTSFLSQKLVNKGYFIVSPSLLAQENSIPLFSGNLDLDFSEVNSRDLGSNRLFEGRF